MFIEVTGLEEVRHTLGEVAPREAANLIRTVVQDVALRVAKDVKASAPIATGSLRAGVRVSRRKMGRSGPKSVVTFARRRDKDGVKIGKTVFYWKFIEYGTRKMSAKPFVGPIKEKYAAEMPRIMRESFGKKLEQYLARRANRAARAQNR